MSSQEDPRGTIAVDPRDSGPIRAGSGKSDQPIEWVAAPPSPESIEDTGLSGEAIIDLLAKVLYTQGVRTGQELIDQVRLPFGVVDELLMLMQQRLLVEVRGTSGHGRGGYQYALSGSGRERAREAMENSKYVGPAPVPLPLYAEWVERQSVRRIRVTRDQMRVGFSDLVLDPDDMETLGPSVNSGRSLFLYGAPGNGKTAIAERIAAMTGGGIYVPYAIDIDGQIVVLFDPVHHVEAKLPDPPSSDAGWLKSGPGHDLRFAFIHRPTVFVGGELMLEQLDLQFDPITKMYKAPFQLKAAGGVLILDDFGRQRVEPRELLNRWVVPLEKQIDYLTLHTGVKFPVPFDARLIFATNLDPTDLVEEAFLRRIHYKVHITNPTPQEYDQILRDVCEVRGVPFRDGASQYIYDKYYQAYGIEPRCCHPRDLVDHIEDIARFEGLPPTLSSEFLDRSCHTYFLLMDPSALAEAQARKSYTGDRKQ